MLWTSGLCACRGGWWLYALLLWSGLCGALPAAERVHVVKRGETLHQVAGDYDVKPSAIAQRNHLKNSNVLRAGQRLIIPSPPDSGTRKYVVKKGDTLVSIANTAGVRLATLLELNRLEEPDRIQPGQELLVPQTATGRARKSGLSAGLKKRLDRVRCSPRWQNIVIHHSGSAIDTPRSMDEYHRSRNMENGLAYHFVVGNGQRMKDGEIFVGNRWIKQIDGGHLASAAANQNSIGICLVGNFNEATPSPRQMDALGALIEYLTQRCHISLAHVMTHREINTRPTECPGKNFSKSRLLSSINR